MGYKVRSGDTMSAIAQRSGVSLAALERANPSVRNANLIQVGESLNIPGKSDGFDPPRKARAPRGAPSHAPAAPKKGHATGGAGRVTNNVGGNLGSWIAQAQTILQNAGVPLSKMNAQDIALIIRHESGGDPNAQNNWDSNARAGHPSIGLMQTIGPTFNAYKLPGHDNIRNPIDNIIAGVRYAISRYGSISNVPGVRDVHAGRAYVGY
jgi:LysM repeat protein